METMQVETGAREAFIDITDRVWEAVRKTGKRDGAVLVFVPHTTCAATINENADPDVVRDILLALDKAIPDHNDFRHAEGNSSAHVKASLVGSSVHVILEEGRLMLGTWQGIYLCEFDGPRTRKVWVKVI